MDSYFKKLEACLQYQIDRVLVPCQLISPEQYAQDVEHRYVPQGKTVH